MQVFDLKKNVSLQMKIWWCFMGVNFTSLPETDDVKQKNKNHETMPNRFYPEHETKRSFVLRYLCPVQDVLTVVFIWCFIRYQGSSILPK